MKQRARKALQWVVAGNPLKAARGAEQQCPVHTEVVHGCAGGPGGIQSTIGCRPAAVLAATGPPGASSTSGRGTSANVASTARCTRSYGRRPRARLLGADDHLCAGQIGEYLVGPIASSAVNPW